MGSALPSLGRWMMGGSLAWVGRLPVSVEAVYALPEVLTGWEQPSGYNWSSVPQGTGTVSFPEHLLGAGPMPSAVIDLWRLGCNPSLWGPDSCPFRCELPELALEAGVREEGTWKGPRPFGSGRKQEKKAEPAREEEADGQLLGQREALSAPHRFTTHYKHCNLVSAPALIKGPLDTLRPLHSTD